jgi:pre-mRNA-splicing factor ATP-dependent RNA helicase DHX15/PRP43
MSTKKQSSKSSKSSKSRKIRKLSNSISTINTTHNQKKQNNQGLEDPLGLNNNPLTNKPYENLYINDTSIGVKDDTPRTYAGISTLWTSKIVYNNRHKLYDAIKSSQVILATAGTGVGKTILIPRIALHALDYKEKVITCCPKRLPTLTNASFVAACMDVPIGQQVGYYFQGTNMTNKGGVESKLIFTTTGSLISRLTGSDPTLADYKCIIVDEAHERSVQTDQLLLLLKQLCLKRRDLKVIIMSATISLETFRDYFPQRLFGFAEVDMGSELSYPVQEKWLDKAPLDWKKTAIDITINILKMTSVGDIMIFVKSAGDANMLCNLLDKAMSDLRKKLAEKPKSRTSKTKTSTKTSSITGSIPKQFQINPVCVKLEGSSNAKEQRLATDAELYKTMKDPVNGYPYTRKVVITTNVAESSITVNGIVFIIDSGYEYTEGYEPNCRIRSLLENNIAQSAVKQRKGRAGRTQPGYCFHLYTKRAQDEMQEYPTPSIEKSDITGDILNLMKLPSANTVKNLRDLLDEFISPPHEKFILNSLRTLAALGAITSIQDNGTITPMGIAMTKFRAIEPNHARAVIASHFYGVSRSVCDIIALATETDGRMDAMFQEFRPDKKKKPEQNKKEERRWMSIMKSFAHPLGDYMTLLKTYKIYMKVAEKIPLDEAAPEPTLEDGAPIDAEQELLELSPEGESPEEDIKQPPSVRKWCRENYINANRMARVRRTSRQIWTTLQQIVRPLQHRREDLAAPQAKRQSKLEHKLEKNNENIEKDVDTSMTELDDVVPMQSKQSKQTSKSSYHESLYSRISKTAELPEQEVHLQSGGFIQRIQQQEAVDRLEPHVRRFPTEEENIMMSLAIGNFVNLAIRTKQGDAYVSCFAATKKFAKISQESFLTGYGSGKQPNIVMYDEMFQSSHEARFMKLNLVNKIPDSVFNRIKELYGNQIKYCI